MQRWRASHAARTAHAYGAELLVCSGGAVVNRWVEAETMAELVVSGGVDPAIVAVEGDSPNSWENAANSRRLTEGMPTVILVSDPLHAARVRSYWCKQEPTDDQRVFVAPIERSWRDIWILAPAACLELTRRARDRVRFR